MVSQQLEEVADRRQHAVIELLDSRLEGLVFWFSKCLHQMGGFIDGLLQRRFNDLTLRVQFLKAEAEGTMYDVGDVELRQILARHNAALPQTASLAQGKHLGHDVLKLVDRRGPKFGLNAAVRHHRPATEKQGRRGDSLARSRKCCQCGLQLVPPRFQAHGPQGLLVPQRGQQPLDRSQVGSNKIPFQFSAHGWPPAGLTPAWGVSSAIACPSSPVSSSRTCNMPFHKKESRWCEKSCIRY